MQKKSQNYTDRDGLQQTDNSIVRFPSISDQGSSRPSHQQSKGSPFFQGPKSLYATADMRNGGGFKQTAMTAISGMRIGANVVNEDSNL